MKQKNDFQTSLSKREWFLYWCCFQLWISIDEDNKFCASLWSKVEDIDISNFSNLLSKIYIYKDQIELFLYL